MQDVPALGQLLGRLCSVPALLQHEPLYTALVRCLLYFCVDHPVTAVETKAQAWAIVSIINFFIEFILAEFFSLSLLVTDTRYGF